MKIYVWQLRAAVLNVFDSYESWLNCIEKFYEDEAVVTYVDEDRDYFSMDVTLISEDDECWTGYSLTRFEVEHYG